MKILTCLFMLAVSFASQARLSYAVLDYYIEDEHYYIYHVDALMHRALLEINGKQWYMRNIIYRNPDSLYIVLHLMEGEFFTANSNPWDSNHKLDGELFIGINKAVDYLSKKNELLFKSRGTNFDADQDTNTTPDIAKRVHAINIEINLSPYHLFAPIIIRDKLFPKDKAIERLLEMRFDGDLLSNEYDAEKLFDATMKSIEYILSLPIPTEKLYFIPWEKVK